MPLTGRGRQFQTPTPEPIFGKGGLVAPETTSQSPYWDDDDLQAPEILNMNNYGAPNPQLNIGGAPSIGSAPSVLDTSQTNQFGELPSTGQFPMDTLDPYRPEFTAPDPRDIESNPLFQSSTRLGQQAIERGAAARGTLLTPGVQGHIGDYIRSRATDIYGQEYNRRLGEFRDEVGIGQHDRASRIGAFGQLFGANATRFGLGLGAQAQSLGAQAQRFGQQRANRLDTYGARRSSHLDYLNAQGQQFGQGRASYHDYLNAQGQQFGQGRSNRLDTLGVQGQEFYQQRSNRLDDYDIYRSEDAAYWDRVFRSGNLGHPA